MFRGNQMSGGSGLVCFFLVAIMFSTTQADESTEPTTTDPTSTDPTTTVSTEVDKGWYTVVGSKTLRPNWEYECAVTVSPTDTSKPTTVTVEIVGQLNSIITYNTSQSATLEPSSTKSIKLQIGDIGPGNYNLTVRGEGGINFSNSTELVLLTKSVSVFIQTDRAVYKPGAKVQFRVLVLDSNLKPHKNGSHHVYITDGDGNRVKEWRQISIKKGVWSGEMQLSDSPVLGDWTIHASVMNNKITKTIEVAEYVLPKFEVSFESPRDVLYKDGKVAVQISAKYTYGGSVKGEATITAKPSHYYMDTSIISKVVPIDGEATVEFDIVKELKLESRWRRDITFKATVEESLTGKKQNGSSSVTFHNKEFNLKLVKKSDYFKPGLRVEQYLQVTRYDGSPAINSNLKIKLHLRHSYDRDSEPMEEGSYEVPPDGLLKLTFDPPANASFLEIKASYENETDWLAHMRPAESPSNNFIQASITTLHPRVNSEVEVELNMTEHNPSVIYQVLGRGGVLLTDSVSVNPGETTATFKFLATPSMTPKSKLLVYYLRQDKEVVADSVDLDMDYAFLNFVKVVSNVSESEPGQGIQLTVESKPNSYVGLLGVDQSSILLKTGNDISKDDVKEEIDSYDESARHRFYSWSPTSTANSIFEDAKAFVLTNGNVFTHQFSDYHGVLYEADSLRPLASPAVAFGTPVAFASAGLPGAAGFGASRPPPKPRLRSKFPETWIWQGIATNEDGRFLVNETVPDTITSWVISAFSLDSKHGLGLIEQPTKIKVFRPFFISLDLPYSIIRGETVTIPVIVFNYMDTEVTADVTLLNNAGQFDFGDTTNSISEKPGEKVMFKKERVTVQPNSGEKTSFTITPTELGYISIKVSARSDIAADLVERKLLVKAEGETQYMNQAVFVDLRKADSLEETVNIDIPDNFVDGSARIEVSAVGDILGTSLQNLERLIRMPFGCGEQNMLNFVPNIVVLDYLKNSKQLNPSIEAKCLKYMETGYQRELTYRHKDGSFSAFGDSDPSGSTWLTAFVLKSFASAEPHMNIDGNIINVGLSWLAGKQAPNGSFPEVGTVSHKDMQGGAGQGLALTSYSLLPFLAYNKPEHKSTIEKSLDYIVKQLDGIRNDSYSLAISTYVLHLADHPAKDTAFQMLQSNAHSARSMKWWKRAAKKTDTENPHSMRPNSVDVEMTAYAMLIYLERGLVEDSMPIMSWLMSQQNSDGGFASTQDTVVALSALSKLAAKVADKNPDITVNFSTDNDFSKDITINSDNSMILQKIQVTGKADKVKVKAKGHGLAVVQVSYSYNVDVKGAWPMFNILPKVTNNSETNQLLLDICSSFVSGSEGDGDESSNMVVMEVSLPSGYTLDQDSLPDLKSSKGVKKVELQEADTHIALYFDKMTKEEICPQIVASRSHKVEKSKPVPVTVYDYYDQSRRARVFYSLPEDTQQPA